MIEIQREKRQYCTGSLGSLRLCAERAGYYREASCSWLKYKVTQMKSQACFPSGSVMLVLTRNFQVNDFGKLLWCSWQGASNEEVDFALSGAPLPEPLSFNQMIASQYAETARLSICGYCSSLLQNTNCHYLNRGDFTSKENLQISIWNLKSESK